MAATCSFAFLSLHRGFSYQECPHSATGRTTGKSGFNSLQREKLFCSLHCLLGYTQTSMNLASRTSPPPQQNLQQHTWNPKILNGCTFLNVTFMGPCIANIFAEYNQQDATFLSLFISVRRSTCFRRFFRPSSGAQNCTYSVRHLSDRYCYLLLVWPG